MDMYSRNGRGASSSIAATRSFSTHRTARALLFAAAWVGMSAVASASPIAIPNADFSDAGNNGSVGGGLIGSSGTEPIGAGPWQGTYAGVLGLLAPPTLTIATGKATISGLGVVSIGINNRGDFDQVLAAPFVPSKHYVLTADVDVGNTSLGLDVLASGNVGLALAEGATIVASTQSSPHVAITGHTGHLYHVALGFDSTNADSGSIGVRLFANPNGIASANLLAQATFHNARLTEASIPAAAPSTLSPASGTPQGAAINNPFSAPLVVCVNDAEGNPLEGVTVNFAVPDSGASATLSSNTAITDVGGCAQVTATANGTEGGYQIIASVDGVDRSVGFDLTNTPAGQPAVFGVVHSGQPQSAISGAPFACMLMVQVYSGDTPAEGATVLFDAPAAGASATLDDGQNTGSMLFETTDANGLAAVGAIANGTPGSYDVTATVTALSSGALAPPLLLASFPLTNLDGNEYIFRDGFEEVPAVCGPF